VFETKFLNKIKFSTIICILRIFSDFLMRSNQSIVITNCITLEQKREKMLKKAIFILFFLQLILEKNFFQLFYFRIFQS